MTDHPCKGLGKAATNAFEAIAVNHQPHCSKVTLQRLLERGLIAREDRLMHFRDGLPPCRIAGYFVPLPVHYQWCTWASEQFGE
ncbi:hypothetical protein [Bradyrhizobium betae]|uniref:Winged helix-turn-helix domain-containing protein n=1 Tax=Bradyrhizobium betae TaxID=244734 RepID=A0A5P6P8Y0_9BRAD|nr:hypothetical protein [Bradyrhizobium betae]MCS3727241.1 hypothetical protein [Bradyrhizobium betae]QFI74847.1 hypothetical protein F8237_22025 [Bradyrhizobium betae]